MLKTIDLCAGIGGIRKGFENAGGFINVLSAEVDKYACLTYEHLYGKDPTGDITAPEFKEEVLNLDFDVLLAGFPCQSFSRAGLQKGLSDATKGGLFYDIAEIIKNNRPKAFLLENVDNLLSIDKGKTMEEILKLLIFDLDYHIVGVEVEGDKLIYSNESFLRNSRNFGLPQNRPRVYIVGFNKREYQEKIALIDAKLPVGSSKTIYTDLNEVLDEVVGEKYFLSQGYLDTLEKHRNRHSKKGNGFGYMVVNAGDRVPSYSNALLATGGSGKERNLILDLKNNHAGKVVGNKQTPINEKNIRNMTPTEWGKLQGFINYAFLDSDGNDTFSFPQAISDTQQYKQFGNAVSIPVIEEMAKFMKENIKRMAGSI